MSENRKGSCLCGGITFTISGEMSDVTTCHCTQCRKQTGHHYAASNANDDQFDISDDRDLLKWYRASNFAQRGFCSECGSALFWKADDSNHMGVMVGSIDGPTGLKLEKQIFTADKGDYYTLSQDAPIFPQDG